MILRSVDTIKNNHKDNIGTYRHGGHYITITLTVHPGEMRCYFPSQQNTVTLKASVIYAFWLE